MSADPSLAAPPSSGRRSWTIFLAGLLVVVNILALVVLYTNATMRLDGRPDPEMIRKAFISMSTINILLGAGCVATLLLPVRTNPPPPTA